MADTDLTQEEQRLAQRLLDARRAANLSQEHVAERLGIPRASVSAIETAKRKVSSLELKRLARLYRRSITDFLDDTPEVGDTADAGGVTDTIGIVDESTRETAALYRAIRALSPEEQQTIKATIRLFQRGPHRNRTPSSSADEQEE